MNSGKQKGRRRYLALTAAAVVGSALAAESTAPPVTPPTTTTPAAAAVIAPLATPAPPPVPALSAEQASYNFGMTFGEQLRLAGLSETLSIDAVSRGIKDAFGGKKLTAAEKQQSAQYVRAVRESAGVRNKAAAKEFLAGNAQKKGVQTTASGLQYKVITAGDAKAASPTAADQVTVQYRGKLLDGTEFDSSFARGQPATFQANRVIKGWQEALLLMKPGASYQLFVSPELAYDMSPPPAIPPGSLLIFDVELVSVQAAPKSN